MVSSYLVDCMERETGIEPATFSLGKWPSIENKEHSVHPNLVLAIENTGFSKAAFSRMRIEQKWSRRFTAKADDVSPFWVLLSGDRHRKGTALLNQ